MKLSLFGIVHLKFFSTLRLMVKFFFSFVFQRWISFFRHGIGYLGFRLCFCWNDTSWTFISWWMWNRSIIINFSVKKTPRKPNVFCCSKWIFSLLGTPTVSEWPEIAQCLYYQTGLPRFPLDGVQLSRLPISNECRQFLKVKPFFLFNSKSERRISSGYFNLQSEKSSNSSTIIRRTRIFVRCSIIRSFTR